MILWSVHSCYHWWKNYNIKSGQLTIADCCDLILNSVDNMIWLERYKGFCESVSCNKLLSEYCSNTEIVNILIVRSFGNKYLH